MILNTYLCHHKEELVYCYNKSDFIDEDSFNKTVLCVQRINVSPIIKRDNCLTTAFYYRH